MNYNSKYLKYKSKYLKLKKQFGGDFNIPNVLFNIILDYLNILDLNEMTIVNTNFNKIGSELVEWFKPIKYSVWVFETINKNKYRNIFFDKNL